MKRTRCIVIAVITGVLLVTGYGKTGRAEETIIQSEQETEVNFAEEQEVKGKLNLVEGKVYEFDNKNNYQISQMEKYTASSIDNTFGTLGISGKIKKNKDENGNTQYMVEKESLTFYYTFKEDKIEEKEKTEWQLTTDSAKSVDGISLKSDIKKGAVIIQSSRDGKKWITDSVKTDLFTDKQSNEIYTAKDIQLENGCYYKVIVAYEMQRKTGEKKNWFNQTTDIVEKKRYAEVYEFYAQSGETLGAIKDSDVTPRKEIGKTVNTGKDNGYFENYALDKEDFHFGWKLGTFVLNGYTRETIDGNRQVFLKNLGDKVTLWFRLDQDIDQLNGNDKLLISNDNNGYDRYFEISQGNFGRGTLIIRYTDYEGKVYDPIIYTNFLEADASTGADTRIQLFEEGDYEVALDYEICKNTGMIIGDEYKNYKIAFSFSIRNGNCMVYPFDVESKNELSEQSWTPNGFYLDLAKSRYLTIDVTKSILKINQEGKVTEDIRFNRPAKDGDTYTDEGIYTFTVKNLYTGEGQTTKTVYVGENKYIKALAKNVLTVEQLNEKIANNVIIDENGTLIEYAEETTINDSAQAVQEMKVKDQELSELENLEKDRELATVLTSGEENNNSKDAPSEGTTKNNKTGVMMCVLIIVMGFGFVILIGWKRKTKKMGDGEK